MAIIFLRRTNNKGLRCIVTVVNSGEHGYRHCKWAGRKGVTRLALGARLSGALNIHCRSSPVRRLGAVTGPLHNHIRTGLGNAENAAAGDSQ